MRAIGVSITSDCVTAVKLRSFLGCKKIGAVQSEKIDWYPFNPVPVGQITDVLKSIHQKLKLTKSDICLCIPNYCFFTHQLNLDSKKTKKLTTNELNYLLEEQLPVDAEQIEARHFHYKYGKSLSCSLSSAITISSVMPLLSRTEQAKINVSFLSGDIFCVGSLIAEKIKTDVIGVCLHGNLAGIILVQKNKIILTRYLGLECEHPTNTHTSKPNEDTIDRLLSELRLILADIKTDKNKLQILVLGDGSLSVTLQNKLCRLFGLDKNPKSVLNKTAVLSKRQSAKLNSLPEISAFAAAKLAISAAKFNFNFSGGKLSSSVGHKKLFWPFMAIAILFIVFLTAFSVGLYSQGNRWQSQELAYRSQQVQIWRGTFPDLAIPSDILMRLASEKKRMEGLAGKATGLPQYSSALEKLRAVICNIPNHIELRLKDIKLNQDRITVTGQARNFTMVEHIAGALSLSGLFRMRPAQSKRVNEHIVDFTVTGEVIKHNESVNNKFANLKSNYEAQNEK